MSELKPRVGAAAIVRYRSKILLVERDKDPARGKWVLPGGGIRFLESIEQAVVREVKEEAGIDVELAGRFKVYELIEPPDEHRIIFYYRAAWNGQGVLKGGTDAKTPTWFDSQCLFDMAEGGMITPFCIKVLREYGALETT